MQTVYYGHSSLSPERRLLSPISTGSTHNHLCPPRRYQSHSCKSAPTERCRKENSREYEDEHWLFSTQPCRHDVRLAPSCQASRASEAHRNHVSCSDYPNEESDLTGPNTPDSPPAVGDRTGNLPTFVLTTFEESSAGYNQSTGQSGTGLDGPLSSESDRLSKKLRGGLSDVKESTRSADPSTGYQELKSNTSGSTNWEKNWEKRKPRRKHDVSEAVNLDSPLSAHPMDLSSAASGSKSDHDSDEKSCSYLSQHDMQFHAIRPHTANSCPELHHQLDEFERSFAIFKDGEQRTDQVRFELSKDPHRYHFHVRNIVTRHFRSIGRRLKRTGSSTFSIRSEFPAPRDSKERRLLARDSADIWASSGNETPIFNTPESNVNLVYPVGNHLDPLAMASIIIATGELDRLSSRASLDQASRTSGSSTGFSHSSPISAVPPYSDSASPNNGASLFNSMMLEVPPPVPFNTPASSSSQSGVASPASRSSHRRGQRRRAQRSRLSEFTTPDEAASPASDFAEHPLSFSTPQIEPLRECSPPHLGQDERGMYPKPLAINRDTYEDTETQNDNPLEDRRKSSIPVVSITPPDKPGSFSRTLSGFSDIDDAISPPSRVSSIGKTPESMYGPRVANARFLPSTPRVLGHVVPSSTIVSDAGLSATSIETFNASQSSSSAAKANHTPACEAQAGPGETADDTGGYTRAESCHPCTCSQDSLFRPERPMREGSADTILIHTLVEVSKGAKSDDDDDDGPRAGK
ncbi:hypothetical protein GGR53DRAFT_517895 [Hypoxylon sp. FL1150]|nr:hypothetical protein GGR53DRAFT_517895 [Hypoxylon sp. FL1150]